MKAKISSSYCFTTVKAVVPSFSYFFLPAGSLLGASLPLA